MDVKAEVNRLAEISRQMAVLKKEKDQLEAKFITLAESDLRDTKRKTAKYIGDGYRVVATMAAKVNLDNPKRFRSEAAGLADDLIKEEVKYALTEAAGRMLGGICKGAYIQLTIEEALKQIASGGQLPALQKKVRGKNFRTDTRAFMAALGCDEAEAERNAYLIAEAAVWQEFDRLTKGLSDQERTELITKIKAAVSVTEHAKIQVEALEG